MAKATTKKDIQGFDLKKSYVTPKGSFHWTAIKFPKKSMKDVTIDGKKTKIEVEEYSIELHLDEADAKLFQARHRQALIDNGIKGSNVKLLELKPVTVPVRDEDGEIEKDEFGKTVKETVDGKYRFTFTARASYTSPKTGQKVSVTIPVFDSKGKEIPNANLPDWFGEGTTGKISLIPSQYGDASKESQGIKYRLEAIQLINLVMPEARGGDRDYGFGEEEDGYVFEGGTANPFEDAAATDDLDDEIPFN